MNTYQQQLATAAAKQLSLIHAAANLDLQMNELNRLRYRVRQAETRLESFSRSRPNLRARTPIPHQRPS